MAVSFTPSSFSSAAASGEPAAASREAVFSVRDYDLEATLASGQAFRWKFRQDAWTGVIGRHWVRLRQGGGLITARTAEPVGDWRWVSDYLQLDLDLSLVLATFPDEPPMREAVAACRGLRLLRQDPWECLACFILSSTKQIVQIQQIVAALCETFGEPLATMAEHGAVYSFPAAERLARATEAQLRGCKMGFRAPYLLAAARRVAVGELDLNRLQGLPVEAARSELMRVPGVGRKIADCVLLFAYGFQAAFPVDVWVLRALRQFYFPRRRPSPKRLRHFSETHFGRNAGYAQQYLFHYVRTAALRARGQNIPRDRQL
jgi:N-glycosylase/DNA lyase